jgi:hypothetical protein
MFGDGRLRVPSTSSLMDGGGRFLASEVCGAKVFKFYFQ